MAPVLEKVVALLGLKKLLGKRPTRTRMMDKSNELPSGTFEEWAFDNSGRNPLAWRHAAEDLLEGANAIKEKVLDLGDGIHSLAAVQAMLLGYAIENLLKGIWIKAGNSMTADGRLNRVPSVGDHDLRGLAKAAGVTLSHDEEAVLGKLTAFVKFAGRYPIATTWEQIKPVRIGKNPVESPKFVSKEDLDVADRLANRLMEVVSPWK